MGAIRAILAASATAHGLPGSDRLEATRAAQRANGRKPAHHIVARVLAGRLSRLSQDEGAPEIDALLGPIATEEGAASGIDGAPIPTQVAAKAVRCLEAPLEVLVERGLIRSSESMAGVLPLMTARVRALAISDPELRQIYAATYAAFRRRRSLLLLNLESQVKLDELPWIAAIGPWVGTDDASRAASRETMVRATRLALEAFPYTLLPNRLIKELRALAVGAGVAVPLVDELAADIFAGAFSGTFLRAAQLAAGVLRGTLYERYYGLRYDDVLALDDVRKERYGAPHSPGFAAMCRDLAPRGKTSRRGSPAENGTIIEQAQILTTHNLAPLLRALDLEATMRPELPALARRCFTYVCNQHRVPRPSWRAQLHVVKNSAYAFRHMVFFLALSEPAEAAAFYPWARGHLEGSSEASRQRLGPALAGLEAVAAGGRFDANGVHAPTGGRRFLGWSVGKHWMF